MLSAGLQFLLKLYQQRTVDPAVGQVKAHAFADLSDYFLTQARLSACSTLGVHSGEWTRELAPQSFKARSISADLLCGAYCT